MVPHLWWQFPVYFQSIWISFIFVPALLEKEKEKKNLKFYVLFEEILSGTADPPLSGRELAVDSPKRDMGTGWWLFLLCRHRPRVSACGEKQFPSPQTLHRDLTCAEQVPLSAPVVGAAPGYCRAPPHPASPAQTSHLATARSRAGENHRMFVVEALNSRHLPTGGVTPL